MKSNLMLLVVFAIAPISVYAGDSPAEQEDDARLTIFKNVRVLSMTEQGVHDDIHVVVSGNSITRIESALDVESVGNAIVIDGRGKTLMPGLADMHTHYWPETGPLYIANSVTTVRVLWGSVESGGWDEDAKTGTIVAPHQYYSGPLMDGPEPIWGDDAVRISSAEQVVGAIESQRSTGFKAVKLYEGLTPDIFSTAVAAAKERGLQVWAHVPRGMTYDEVVDLGVDSIEHLNNAQDILLPDGVDKMPGRAGYLGSWVLADSEKMAVLAKKVAEAGVWNAPTYQVTMQKHDLISDVDAFFARPEITYLEQDIVSWWQQEAATDNYGHPDAKAAAENFRAMIKALYDAGAPLLVGTDTPNPFVIPGYSIHDELRAFVDSGIPAEDVLRIATADAAEFLGEKDQWGVIAVGARADLVLLDDDPVLHLETLRSPVGVMVNGRWLDRKAIRHALAETRAFAEASKSEIADPEPGDVTDSR